jgi:predicted XRE-type DNA-binding protein
MGRRRQDAAGGRESEGPFGTDAMPALKAHIGKQGWTQAEAASHLGVTQPRIYDLVRSKIAEFGLDNLVTMLARAGMAVDIRVRKAPAKRQAPC